MIAYVNSLRDTTNHTFYFSDDENLFHSCHLQQINSEQKTLPCIKLKVPINIKHSLFHYCKAKLYDVT